MKTFRDFIFEKLGRMRIVMLVGTNLINQLIQNILLKNMILLTFTEWHVKKRSRKRIRNR